MIVIIGLISTANNYSGGKMLTFLSRINSFQDLNTVYHPENNNSEEKKNVQLIPLLNLREVTWRYLFFLVMGLGVVLLYSKE